MVHVVKCCKDIKLGGHCLTPWIHQNFTTLSNIVNTSKYTFFVPQRVCYYNLRQICFFKKWSWKRRVSFFFRVCFIFRIFSFSGIGNGNLSSKDILLGWREIVTCFKYVLRPGKRSTAAGWSKIAFSPLNNALKIHHFKGFFKNPKNGLRAAEKLFPGPMSCIFTGF